MAVVGIKFKNNGMSYHFQTSTEVNVEDKVIVETERGVQLGIVDKINIESDGHDLKKIIRVANEEDYNKYLNNLAQAKKVLLESRELIKKQNLNMSLIDVSYSLDKKQLLLNFISDERVDFRELVKELANKYHARIELHQVGVRDKAREIGGIGLCGRKLCCNGILKTINSVNISMVKNQNIALNPTKINGACGRLLCCFGYENDVYEENRSVLPKVGEKVKYNKKNCEVVSVDVLNKKYTVKVDENNVEEVVVND